MSGGVASVGVPHSAQKFSPRNGIVATRSNFHIKNILLYDAKDHSFMLFRDSKNPYPWVELQIGISRVSYILKLKLIVTL